VSIIPGMIVAPPEPLRRRYGILDAAAGPIDLPPHGEGGGIRFVPVTCGEAYVLGVNCYGGEVSAPEKPMDEDNGEVSSGVFAVLATMECGAPGYTVEEYRGKVLRRLEATEQAAVERAFWSGVDFEGNSLGILSLDEEAEAVTSGYDSALITDVVGALERYAYTDNQYGGVAYIHAPIEVAAFAAEAGLILQDGPNRKVTPLGSVWAFGAYPAGEIIVTGQTAVWRAPEIQVYDSFDRTSNGMVLVAERAYSVAFECFAGRAEFDPLEEVGS
jgi:hypothetical protein